MRWTDIARRQAGLVTSAQLSACGVSASARTRMVAAGRLEPTTAVSVFAVAGAPTLDDARSWLAVLATSSPLSFLSAAQVWQMPVVPDGWVHITRLDRRRLDWPPGVRVHRVGLAPEDVTNYRGMLVTTPAETALDCMGWLRVGAARSFADRAIQQRWITPDLVRRRLDHQRGRWGNRQLRRLLSGLGDGAAAESERRLHRLLRKHGITGWAPNLSVIVRGNRVQIDVAFPDIKLAIEVDGFAYHSAEERFQRDRTRQNLLIAAGWRVLRFTWADIEDRPAYVIASVRTLLAA